MNSKLKTFYKVIMAVILTAIITVIITTAVVVKNHEVFKNKFYSETLKTVADGEFNFDELKALIRSEFLFDIDEEKLREGVIKGYVAGLGDEYSEYFTKEEMEDFEEETSGRFVGIGIYLANDKETNSIIIIGIIKGNSAEEHGIQAGDIIKSVNGVEYTGEELEEAVSNIKGEENTTVDIVIIRDGEELNFTLERRFVDVPSVASKVLDNYKNIGYVAVASFDEDTSEEFKKEVDKLIEENDIKGLIIDLRSNGGGIVTEATNIADYFLEPEEIIISTKSKKQEKESRIIAKETPIYEDIQVVILVNEYTASASEILAAALKENDKATIVGITTYGKGLIQTLFKLQDGSGLKITTAEYYTPDHNLINEIGVSPDIEIDLTKDKNGKYETEETNDAQLLKAVEEINKLIK